MDVRGCPGCDRGLIRPIRDLLEDLTLFGMKFGHSALCYWPSCRLHSNGTTSNATRNGALLAACLLRFG